MTGFNTGVPDNDVKIGYIQIFETDYLSLLCKT